MIGRSWHPALLPAGSPAPSIVGSRSDLCCRVTADDFSRFAATVPDDPELVRELAPIEDDVDFLARACALARARGYEVDPADVERALAAARRDWFERWI
jgi:hypothetical protein